MADSNNQSSITRSPISIKTALPGPKATEIIARDAKRVSPSYTRDYPFVMRFHRAFRQAVHSGGGKCQVVEARLCVKHREGKTAPRIRACLELWLFCEHALFGPGRKCPDGLGPVARQIRIEQCAGALLLGGYGYPAGSWDAEQYDQQPVCSPHCV